jgi:MoxR-like ATPase
MERDVREITENVKQASEFLELLRMEMKRVIVGQSGMTERLLVALLTGGHILLEGVPGLAKTLAVRTFAACIQVAFRRIQFTPDLLPADLLGTLVYNPKTGEFTTRTGPLFANIILADEINRAPAKVQSALLEAMQERQVTIGETTFALPSPFLVLATQNPIEQEGTYSLPEAQVDRFLLKLRVGYPGKEDEREILDRFALGAEPVIEYPACGPEEIRAAREVVATIYVDERIRDYIVAIVRATREPGLVDLEAQHLIEYGASPRATIALATSARANAFLAGRGYVTPQDVKSVAMDVLRHRVIVSYEAEAEEVTSERIVQDILDRVKVP